MSRAEVRARLARDRQRTEQMIAARGGRPYPKRITTALDLPVGPDGPLPPLEGPHVDVACGAVEPAVDRWEAGEEVPTRRQIELLAALTGYPLSFFFKPPTVTLETGWLCGSRGCEQFDERPDAQVVPLFAGTLW